MESTENVVLRILENLVPEDKRNLLSLNSSLRGDLGLDSIKLISLVMELQNQTDFDITRVEDDEDLRQVTTVQDVVAIVDKQCIPGG